MYFMSTFCGVCLTDRREVQNINNKDTDDISLAEKLKYCSFKTAWIDDDLPLFICYKCYNDLKIAYSFKKMCVMNSTILKGYVSRLKYGGNPLTEHEYGQLRVEIEKNKIYGVNILLYERVQVEQIDMEVSSSEDEANLFEDTDIDIKEEQIKIEYNQEQNSSENINNSGVKQSENFDKNSELITVKEETITESEKDICFVEVKSEFDSNFCPEPEHILPDIDCSSVTTNLTSNLSNLNSNLSNLTSNLSNLTSNSNITSNVSNLNSDLSNLNSNLSSSTSNSNITSNLSNLNSNLSNLTSNSNDQTTNTDPGSEVNLLNIINTRISRILTSDGKNSVVPRKQVAKKSTTTATKQPSTLRSLLESSTVAQNYMMQSFQENKRNDTKEHDDNIEYISSDSETNDSTRQNEKSKTKYRSKLKRKINNISSTNNSLPVINNILPATNIIEPRPMVNSVEPAQQYINTVISPPSYPEVTQNYPLLTDNLNTTVSAKNFILPTSYPSTAEPTNTFLIIYDDINPPAAPLVANTDTTNSFILPKTGIVQNTVPFENSSEVSNSYVVPSVSTVPLVINSDTNTGFMLPTSSLTYHNENSNSQFMSTSNFIPNTGVSCQNVQASSYNTLLPTTEDKNSPDSETSLVCPICKKSFTKNKYLKQHFETHYLVTHKCNVCAKTFMNEKSLKAHILMHKGGLNYQCDYCSKMFAELSEFKKHSSVHVSVKQFECCVR